MSPGPATALLAAVATAAFLIDRIWALAALTADPARALPAGARRAPLAVHRRSAVQRPHGDRDLAAHVVVGRRDADLGGPDASRDRPRRPLDGRDPDRRRERAPARRRGPRVQRVHVAASITIGWSRRRASPDARRSPSRSPPASSPASSGTRRGSPSRCAVAASSCTARGATRRCSRRSSPGRSSGRPASPRRWRRGGSDAAGRPARRGRPGRGSTGRRSSERSCSSGWRSRGSSVGRRPLVRLSRRRPGRPRRLARARGGRDRCSARSVGKRQVDLAAGARRARAAFPRRPFLGPGRGGGARYAIARPGGAGGNRRLGLPGSRRIRS